MIRLLIVDDSPLMRRLLSALFGAAGDFSVAVARSGEEALAMLHSFAPEVISLDVHMPGMDGLACLDRIMVERPTPVVMVSSLTGEGADETIEALALGAVDFVAKPRGMVSIEIEALAPLLIDKLRAAARARIPRTTRLTDRIRLRRDAALRRPGPPAAAQRSIAGATSREGLVILGTSTGGPGALDRVLGALPAGFAWPVVVAQHMPASFTGALARRLDRLCPLHVAEVSRPRLLLPGHAYIGRGDADLLIGRRGGALVAMAAPSSPESFWHPSVDRLVRSAMQQLGPESLVGVLMTGMGNDGAAAMTELALAGGHTIAQSQDTAVVWGMPGALVAAGGASRVIPLDRIADALIRRAGR